MSRYIIRLGSNGMLPPPGRAYECGECGRCCPDWRSLYRHAKEDHQP